MKKVTYSSLSIHGHAPKNLYEEHVHVLLSLQTIQQHFSDKKNVSKRTCILVHLYVHHPCDKSRLPWHFKDKIHVPSQIIPHV